MFDHIMVVKFLDGTTMKGFGSLISPGETIMEFKDLEEKERAPWLAEQRRKVRLFADKPDETPALVAGAADLWAAAAEESSAGA